RIGHIERDRLLHQHILAGIDGADGAFGVELRRQRHHDGVDVVALIKVVGLDRQAILLRCEAFGPRGIGIRDGMEDAKRFEGTDMVTAPITTSKDCDTRFHTPCARLAWRTHIHAARATQPRYGLACRALSTMFSAIQSRRLICRPEWLSIAPR